MTGKRGVFKAPLVHTSPASIPQTSSASTGAIQPNKKIKIALKSSVKTVELDQNVEQIEGVISKKDSEPDQPVSEPEPISEITSEPADNNTESKSEPTSSTTKPKPRRSKNRPRMKPIGTLSEDIKWEDSQGDGKHDVNFVNWQPPEGQTGDGRTKLNEKYGY